MSLSSYQNLSMGDQVSTQLSQEKFRIKKWGASFRIGNPDCRSLITTRTPLGPNDHREDTPHFINL